MNTRWIALLLLGALLPAGAAGDEFRSQGFGCHVTFPGKHTTAQERTQQVGWVITELQDDAQGTYALAAFNLTTPTGQPITPKALEDVITQTRGEAIAAKGYELISEARRKLDDRHPGLDLVMEKKGQRIRMRIYFVGTRVFQIMVSGEKEWTESAEATKFLDSFGHNG